jgi:hypothetical protein
MIYEFECPKGHITEATVPMGTKTWPCDACFAEQKANKRLMPELHLAHRILSPTMTTFVFADTGKRVKHVQKIATRHL